MSGDLTAAIDHCTASCTFLASVMPKYHPLTILQFVTLAELSVVGEMWEEAKMAYEIGKEGGGGEGRGGLSFTHVYTNTPPLSPLPPPLAVLEGCKVLYSPCTIYPFYSKCLSDYKNVIAKVKSTGSDDKT